MKWFKFYGQDFLTDSKLGSLNPYQRLMWVTLLCVASQDEEKTGVLKFVSEARIVALSGLEYQDMDEFYGIRHGDTFRRFEEIGLVSFPDKDTMLIVNYHKKQVENMSVAERVAAHRAKKSAENKPDVTKCNKDVLQSNNSVTLDKKRVDKKRVDTTVVSSEEASRNKEVAEIIDLFKKTLSPSLSFGNKTQRKAVEAMIDKWDFEKVKRMAEKVISVQGTPYAPRASTPHAMWTKIGDFVSYFQGQSAGGGAKQNNVATV